MSADGTKIVFLDRPSGAPGLADVLVINVDGTGLTNLTNGAYNGVNGPNISPDGATIVFTSGATPQLWTIPVTGGAATQITTGAGTRNGSWTPDGKILGNPSATPEIVRMNADGTGLVTLLSGSTISMANLSWPVASPDGTKMVFSAAPQAGSMSLWVSNIDGTNPVRILDTATFGQQVDLALGVWSSNGGAPVTTTTTPAADPVVPTFTG